MFDWVFCSLLKLIPSPLRIKVRTHLQVREQSQLLNSSILLFDWPESQRRLRLRHDRPLHESRAAHRQTDRTKPGAVTAAGAKLPTSLLRVLFQVLSRDSTMASKTTPLLFKALLEMSEAHSSKVVRGNAKRANLR